MNNSRSTMTTPWLLLQMSSNVGLQLKTRRKTFTAIWEESHEWFWSNPTLWRHRLGPKLHFAFLLERPCGQGDRGQGLFQKFPRIMVISIGNWLNFNQFPIGIRLISEKSWKPLSPLSPCPCFLLPYFTLEKHKYKKGFTTRLESGQGFLPTRHSPVTPVCEHITHPPGGRPVL